MGGEDDFQFEEHIFSGWLKRPTGESLSQQDVEMFMVFHESLMCFPCYSFG